MGHGHSSKKSRYIKQLKYLKNPEDFQIYHRKPRVKIMKFANIINSFQNMGTIHVRIH